MARERLLRTTFECELCVYEFEYTVVVVVAAVVVGRHYQCSDVWLGLRAALAATCLWFYCFFMLKLSVSPMMMELKKNRVAWALGTANTLLGISSHLITGYVCATLESVDLCRTCVMCVCVLWNCVLIASLRRKKNPCTANTRGGGVIAWDAFVLMGIRFHCEILYKTNATILYVTTESSSRSFYGLKWHVCVMFRRRLHSKDWRAHTNNNKKYANIECVLNENNGEE